MNKTTGIGIFIGLVVFCIAVYNQVPKDEWKQKTIKQVMEMGYSGGKLIPFTQLTSQQLKLQEQGCKIQECHKGM